MNTNTNHSSQIASYERGNKTGFVMSFCNEEQSELAERKGCGCMSAGMVWVDWYCKRTGDKKPVYRVKWFFPIQTKKPVYVNGYTVRRKVWCCSEKNTTFDFTEEGLAAAVKFAQAL